MSGVQPLPAALLSQKFPGLVSLQLVGHGCVFRPRERLINHLRWFCAPAGAVLLYIGVKSAFFPFLNISGNCESAEPTETLHRLMLLTR